MSEDKDVDIEKVMFPDAWKLIEDEEGNLSATIVDEELDPFTVHFNNDDCVVIETDGMTSICLGSDTMERLQDLIHEAWERYSEMKDEDE